MGELVLICGRDPYSASGGSEDYHRATARTALALGLRPHLFAIGRPRVYSAPEGTVHVIRSLPRPIRMITAPLHEPALARAVVRFLADQPGPHVVHSFGSWSGVGVRACQALRRRGVEAYPIATVWSPMGHEHDAKRADEVVRGSPRLRLVHHAEAVWARRVVGRYEARAFRRSAAVLVNYASVRTLLAEAYGPSISVQIVRYSASSAFEPLPPVASAPPAGLPAGDAPLVVTVSRHDGRKGLDVHIRALALLRGRGIAFRACLVGPGVLLEGHRALVRDLGLADCVSVPGRVPAVLPYLQAADVFALPSLQEGSGSVAVLEAMQAGVAIVASGVDGIPEDLTDGADALLVPPGDPERLAKALERLLTDQALRDQLGQTARQTYERRFSPAVAVGDLGRVYARFGLLDLPGAPHSPRAGATPHP